CTPIRSTLAEVRTTTAIPTIESDSVATSVVVSSRACPHSALASSSGPVPSGTPISSSSAGPPRRVASRLRASATRGSTPTASSTPAVRTASSGTIAVQLLDPAQDRLAPSGLGLVLRNARALSGLEARQHGDDL